jgi:peptidoglycan/xylan/chitin deacetylase (PgdA/CDA1 family)
MIEEVLYYCVKYIPLISKATRKKKSLRIVYYHRINIKLDKYYFNNGISLNVFKQQLDYLTSKFKIITLTEALNKSHNNEDLSDYLCITFDDGFSECYTHIFPELKKRNIKATFFLIENVINNVDMMWRNKLLWVENSLKDKTKVINDYNDRYKENNNSSDSLLKISNNWKMSEKEERANFVLKNANIMNIHDFMQKEKPYLEDNQIFEMLDNNQEIGSHTKSHPFCDQLNHEEIIEEIIDPVKRLNDRFGVKSSAFSYPFGNTPNQLIEKYILDNTGLELLLGIEDNLSNDTYKYNWQRVGMEKNYKRSLISLNLKSLIRSYKKV